MAIADKITALQTIKSDIKDAITTKTGTDAGDNMTTYADKILAITTGGSSTPCGSGNNHVDANGVWHRPDEWDDIESMVIPEGNSELYFLYANHLNGGSFCRLRPYGSGMTWARGHVSNGVFTPATSYVSVSSGGYISVNLENLEDDYTVIHLKGTSITQCTTASSTANYPNASASLNTCLMRYGRLPKCTSGVFQSYYLESDNIMDFAKDLTDTTIYVSASYYNNINMARWRHSGWNIANNKVGNLSSVFASCVNLIDVDDLDFTGWCSETTTNLASMFQTCQSLNREIIVKDWIVTNVTTMASMFSNCFSVPKITGFETWSTADECTNTSSMFYGTRCLFCDLDLSSLKCGTSTGIFSNPSGMFSNCSTTSIKIKGWNFSNVTTYFTTLFNACSHVKSIDISDCIFGPATSFNGLFGYCYKLEEIILDGVDFSSIITNTTNALQNFASYCYSLKSVISRNCTPMDSSIVYKDGTSSYGYVFYGDQQLRYLDISWMDMSVFTGTATHRYMLNNCYCLVDFYPPINITKNFYISSCAMLSHDSIIRVINNLVPSTATTKPILYMGTVNQAKLTDEEKQLVTDKGWALG